MNAKRVSAAAGVIHGSQVAGRQTAAGLAADLESACLLQSPETAAELERLRARVDEVERAYTFDTAELKQERDQVVAEIERFGIYGAAVPATKALVKRADELVTENGELRARVAELEAERAEGAAVNESLSRALHDEMLAGSALYAALTMPTTPEQRQAALDRFTTVAQRIGQKGAPTATPCTCPPADRPHQVGCPLDEVPVSERPVNELTAVFAPVASCREDPHDSPLYHPYTKGRDFPQTGGAS